MAVTHRPDDGGSKDLWNVGKLLPYYTALQPRRQPSSFLHQNYLNMLHLSHFNSTLIMLASCKNSSLWIIRVLSNSRLRIPTKCQTINSFKIISESEQSRSPNSWKLKKNLSIVVFCAVTPCRLLCGYERFGGTYRLHLQETIIDIFTAARTSYLWRRIIRIHNSWTTQIKGFLSNLNRLTDYHSIPCYSNSLLSETE
jgi:hypothetical protein